MWDDYLAVLLAVVLIAIATVMAEAVRVAEENSGSSERGDDMPILVNLDVMLAGARCARAQLAERVGITEQNISLLKSGRCAASASTRWRASAPRSIANRATCSNTAPEPKMTRNESPRPSRRHLLIGLGGLGLLAAGLPGCGGGPSGGLPCGAAPPDRPPTGHAPEASRWPAHDGRRLGRRGAARALGSALDARLAALAALDGVVGLTAALGRPGLGAWCAGAGLATAVRRGR